MEQEEKTDRWNFEGNGGVKNPQFELLIEKEILGDWAMRKTGLLKGSLRAPGS